MTKIERTALAAVAAAAIACSACDRPSSSPPAPTAPPSEGAVGFGGAGRMAGGTLTADVRIGTPFGAQKAQGGTLTITEPVLTR